MSNHSRLSPSSAHRWVRCPGSVRESEKYPNVSGPSAIDGTHSHTLLEKALETGFAGDFIGESLSDHEGEFVVDALRAERVQVAVNYVVNQTDFSGKAVSSGLLVDIFSERRVDPSYLLERGDLAGTVDITLVYPDGTIEIVDYKDGMSPVIAEGNEQLELYALGVLAEYKLPPNQLLVKFDKVKMTIIQPKLAIKGLPTITSHEMPIEELLAKIDYYKHAAARTDMEDLRLIPGESQCKWCPAKGGCSALKDHSLQSLEIVEIKGIAEQSANKNPNEMTASQIREVIEAAPLIRQFLVAVEEEALNRMKSGTKIDGLKVVRGRGSRKWAYPDNEIAEKLIKMGIPKSVVYKTELVTVAQAEKLAWEVKSKGETITKKLTDRQLKTLEQEYVKKSEGALTIVPESDSRPSAITDASSLFSPVIEETPLPAWLLS